jgi:tellurite resistance protein
MSDPQINLLWIEIATTAADDELDAAAAAYALVACVDNVLDAGERKRFEELVPSQGKGPRVREAFLSHVEALMNDFEKGRKAAFAALAHVKGQGVPADRVLRIAQMAVVADGDIGEAEEAILQEIGAALGNTPSGGA